MVLDFIDCILDKSNLDSLKKKISSKQMLKEFMNVFNNFKYPYIQNKILGMIKKWGIKYSNKIDKYPNFTEFYQTLLNDNSFNYEFPSIYISSYNEYTKLNKNHLNNLILVKENNNFEDNKFQENEDSYVLKVVRLLTGFQLLSADFYNLILDILNLINSINLILDNSDKRSSKNYFAYIMEQKQLNEMEKSLIFKNYSFIKDIPYYKSKLEYSEPQCGYIDKIKNDIQLTFNRINLKKTNKKIGRFISEFEKIKFNRDYNFYGSHSLNSIISQDILDITNNNVEDQLSGYEKYLKEIEEKEYTGSFYKRKEENIIKNSLNLYKRLNIKNEKLLKYISELVRYICMINKSIENSNNDNHHHINENEKNDILNLCNELQQKIEDLQKYLKFLYKNGNKNNEMFINDIKQISTIKKIIEYSNKTIDIANMYSDQENIELNKLENNNSPEKPISPTKTRHINSNIYKTYSSAGIIKKRGSILLSHMRNKKYFSELTNKFSEYFQVKIKPFFSLMFEIEDLTNQLNDEIYKKNSVYVDYHKSNQIIKKLKSMLNQIDSYINLYNVSILERDLALIFQVKQHAENTMLNFSDRIKMKSKNPFSEKLNSFLETNTTNNINNNLNNNNENFIKKSNENVQVTNNLNTSTNSLNESKNLNTSADFNNKRRTSLLPEQIKSSLNENFNNMNFPRFEFALLNSLIFEDENDEIHKLLESIIYKKNILNRLIDIYKINNSNENDEHLVKINELIVDLTSLNFKLNLSINYYKNKLNADIINFMTKIKEDSEKIINRLNDKNDTNYILQKYKNSSINNNYKDSSNNEYRRLSTIKNRRTEETVSNSSSLDSDKYNLFS